MFTPFSPERNRGKIQPFLIKNVLRLCWRSDQDLPPCDRGKVEEIVNISDQSRNMLEIFKPTHVFHILILSSEIEKVSWNSWKDLHKEHWKKSYVHYTSATGESITHSLLWYLANSFDSKRTWKAFQTGGAAAKVLLTLILPNENPVPMGWSMYITRSQQFS